MEHQRDSPEILRKGLALESEKNRGGKLLDHEIKLFEKVPGERLRKLTSVCVIDRLFFGPGRSTTGGMFIVRELQNKYEEIKKLRIKKPRSEIEWAQRRQEACDVCYATVRRFEV